MVEAVISALIYICIVAILAYIILWVLAAVGIALPPQVIQLLWIIAALVCLLILMRLLLPAIGLRGLVAFGSLL